MTAKNIPDEWLLGYAAGTLNEGQNLLAACHIAMKPELRADVRMLEAVGGSFLQELPDSAMPAGLMNRVMTEIDRGMPALQQGRDRKPDAEGLPAPLADYLGTSLNRLKWRLLGPGLRHSLLWTDGKGRKAWLLRGKGGAEIPEHGHTADEWTLVLKGGYQALDQHYLPGDIEIADGDVRHTPMLDPDAECICLAYTEGVIRPSSPIARLLQPFIGL